MSSYFISSVSLNSQCKTTEKDILTFIKKTWDLTTKITEFSKDLQMVEGFPKYFLVYVSNAGFESGIKAITRTAQLPPNSQILTLDVCGLQGLIQQLKLPNKMLLTGNQQEDIDVIRKKNLETLLGLQLKIAEIIHEKFEKVTTILLADLENFTRRTEENRLESAGTVLKMSRIFQHEVELHGGKGMNTEGDSYIAFFDKADQAVQAALKAVEQIKLYNTELLEERKIYVHVGLSTGEILFNNGRPFIGDAVNIAARIMKKIESNKVVVSETTYKEISGYRGFNFTSRGFEELKGIKKPVQLYEVEMKKITNLT
jgi:class 3 adenylate cyclase